MNQHQFSTTAALRHLDIFTLSEDWVLAAAQEAHWKILAQTMGQPPSSWIDSQGDQIYGAFVWLSTRFDFSDPVTQDQTVEATCNMVAVRKPHALSVTQFRVDGKVKAEASLLSSFIKRAVRGSNKKFARTRELWTEDDRDGDRIDDLLDRHHQMKSRPVLDNLTMTTNVNRIRDFNAADFLYFKNYVQFSKAAEWAYGRGGQTQLNAERECFFYGNVEDGEDLMTHVAPNDQGLLVAEHHTADGTRIFISESRMEPVTIERR